MQQMAWHYISNKLSSLPTKTIQWHIPVCTSEHQSELTPCGLVTPYGIIDLHQHWFRKWLIVKIYRAITEPQLTLDISGSPMGLRAPWGSQKYPWLHWQKCITWTNTNLSRVIPSVTCWMQFQWIRHHLYVFLWSSLPRSKWMWKDILSAKFDHS